jgi:hypothetical protein
MAVKSFELLLEIISMRFFQGFLANSWGVIPPHFFPSAIAWIIKSR